MTFGKVLKLEREKKGMSQIELANALKFSKSRISMYENENRQPNFEDLEIICDFFNVDMDYMTGKSKIRRKHPFDGEENSYYLDEETQATMDEIFHQGEYQVLLDAPRKLSKKQLDALIDTIENMIKMNEDS